MLNLEKITWQSCFRRKNTSWLMFVERFPVTNHNNKYLFRRYNTKISTRLFTALKINYSRSFQWHGKAFKNFIVSINSAQAFVKTRLLHFFLGKHYESLSPSWQTTDEIAKTSLTLERIQINVLYETSAENVNTILKITF